MTQRTKTQKEEQLTCTIRGGLWETGVKEKGEKEQSWKQVLHGNYVAWEKQGAVYESSVRREEDNWVFYSE